MPKKSKMSAALVPFCQSRKSPLAMAVAAAIKGAAAATAAPRGAKNASTDVAAKDIAGIAMPTKAVPMAMMAT